MKTLYFSQPNSKYGNSIYFPYAAGSLVAYAFRDPTVRDVYRFGHFIYKKEKIKTVVAKIKEPFLVGFSCYVWNYEYNKALAAEIKKRWPGCITVFGGHQISKECDAVRDTNIDILLFGEGEESFLRLLRALAQGTELSALPNLMIRKNGEPYFTHTETVFLPNRVSPYLDGWFEPLVENEKELLFSAILETNRGCPNRCAFCDWGNIKANVRRYDEEMVRAEIDWFSEKKIEYVYAADANFGLFPQDEGYIDYLVKKHTETGYPLKFQATYSKNNPETVFRLNKKLNDADMSKGATLSFQSMSSTVLESIYRKNMPLERFQELMRMYHAHGISAYSELILGLPGETYESFREGLEALLENGQHMSINIFNCELLNNSIMNDPGYMEKYGIRTSKIEQHQYHVVPYTVGIKEYSRIIVSTASMPGESWIASNILGVFMRAFHNLGLLQCFAIYLFYERGVRYMDLYEQLIAYAKQASQTVCGRIYRWLYGKYAEILSGGGSLTWTEPAFGKLIWPLEEATFLKVIGELPLFLDEIREFLSGFFEGDAVYGDLFRYQYAVLKTPGAKKTVLSFDYDWHTYFMGIYQNSYAPPKKQAVRYLIDPGNIASDLPEFAKNTIWFGRRGGQNIIEAVTELPVGDDGDSII